MKRARLDVEGEGILRVVVAAITAMSGRSGDILAWLLLLFCTASAGDGDEDAPLPIEKEARMPCCEGVVDAGDLLLGHDEIGRRPIRFAVKTTSH